ncbi:hypothetical protein [Nocardia sp. XZ_19_231]|uniref:hypothetical protein n=1 Tax=Nocardia sp. XZ_19_231 TaxID=2769252 RepID=UPI00188F938B|nr:hypothetical protein [Nocardia sp. XZ_19_231]
MKPIAIGYLRSDISGTAQDWDEIRIRSLARRYGYDLAKTIVFTPRTSDPITQLITIAHRTDAEAVFTPRMGHLGIDLPIALIRTCDVVTVDDENIYARAYFTRQSPTVAP